MSTIFQTSDRPERAAAADKAQAAGICVTHAHRTRIRKPGLVKRRVERRAPRAPSGCNRDLLRATAATAAVREPWPRYRRAR
jgi:hypothetical protein